MLADLPSVDDGNFTQTEAGQAADAALESMDTEEGSIPILLSPAYAQVYHLGHIWRACACGSLQATLGVLPGTCRGHQESCDIMPEHTAWSCLPEGEDLGW